MTRRQIKKLLLTQKGTQTNIARRLNIDPANVYKWMRGETTSRRIAEEVKVEVARILAERDNAAA